jgi:hypothetical protein
LSAQIHQSCSAVVNHAAGKLLLVRVKKSPVMSEQEIIVPPPQPHRQDARDLQSRLYREIGLAAVEAALFAPEPDLTARPETRAERPVRAIPLRRNAA